MIYRGSRILLHECTFLDSVERGERTTDTERGHPHSCLEEVLEIARAAEVGRLGLYHVSRRYEDEQILARVREECVRQKVTFPVSVACRGVSTRLSLSDRLAGRRRKRRLNHGDHGDTGKAIEPRRARRTRRTAKA